MNQSVKVTTIILYSRKDVNFDSWALYGAQLRYSNHDASAFMCNDEWATTRQYSQMQDWEKLAMNDEAPFEIYLCISDIRMIKI